MSSIGLVWANRTERKKNRKNSYRKFQNGLQLAWWKLSIVEVLLQRILYYYY